MNASCGWYRQDRGVFCLQLHNRQMGNFGGVVLLLHAGWTVQIYGELTAGVFIMECKQLQCVLYRPKLHYNYSTVQYKVQPKIKTSLWVQIHRTCVLLCVRESCWFSCVHCWTTWLQKCTLKYPPSDPQKKVISVIPYRENLHTNNEDTYTTQQTTW